MVSVTIIKSLFFYVHLLLNLLSILYAFFSFYYDFFLFLKIENVKNK
jgi:hypothetical protein